MSHRKLRIYCDADLASDVEVVLRGFKELNCESARSTRTTTRSDADHFQYAIKRQRVLVTHDDDYLANAYSIMDTHGVIVIDRGQRPSDVVRAFAKFLIWAWPLIRSELPRSSLPGLKVRLSNSGFHYWQRTSEGLVAEDYFPF